MFQLAADICSAVSQWLLQQEGYTYCRCWTLKLQETWRICTQASSDACVKHCPVTLSCLYMPGKWWVFSPIRLLETIVVPQIHHTWQRWHEVHARMIWLAPEAIILQEIYPHLLFVILKTGMWTKAASAVMEGTGREKGHNLSLEWSVLKNVSFLNAVNSHSVSSLLQRFHGVFSN